MKVSFYKHNLGIEEKESLLSSLDLDFLTTGSIVDRFEEEFSNYIGMRYTVGLMSCTAALHLALLALGIGPGDEVITTPMTFAATSLAIIHTGANPVWVDIEESTGNINADLIEKAITPKTKAILPVHLYGQMCDMKKIREIADKYKLFIIEDAAHTLEGSRDEIGVGHLSDAVCFSFYATKSITCGEGGAVSTNNKELADKIRMLRSHGMSSDAAKRFNESYKHWDLLELGWKYNMSNIQAAILIPQIKKIWSLRQSRKNLYETYIEELENIKGLEFPKVLEDTKHSYYLFTILVDPNNRDILLKKFHDAEIGVTVNYRSINLLDAFLKQYNKQRSSYPISESIGDRTISLPLYPRLSDEEIYYVVDFLRNNVQ